MRSTEATTTLTVRLVPSIRDELNELAKSTDRNRNTLITEALRGFVDVQRWQIARIQEGIRAGGEFASEEEMRDLWAEFGLERKEERAAG